MSQRELEMLDISFINPTSQVLLEEVKKVRKQEERAHKKARKKLSILGGLVAAFYT